MTEIALAFLTGFAVTLLEIVSRFERAPRLAVLNPWGLCYLCINGFASALVFLLAKDFETLTFHVLNPYAKAFILGLEWQVLLRSKVFSIGGGGKGKEVLIGAEYFYKKYSEVFERQIEETEDIRVNLEIRRTLQGGLSNEEIREIAIDYVEYRKSRKKISKSEAGELKKLIEDYMKENKPAPVMYLVFEMSNLSTLTKLFRKDERPTPDAQNSSKQIAN